MVAWTNDVSYGGTGTGQQFVLPPHYIHHANACCHSLLISLAGSLYIMHSDKKSVKVFWDSYYISDAAEPHRAVKQIKKLNHKQIF